MDSSHKKQVATFEKLLGFCNAHGAIFNPSKVDLQSTALHALLTSAQQSLEAVKTARTEFDNAVNVRNEAFNGLPKFMTRIVNTLAAGGASRATVKEAYAYTNRFRPKSKKKILDLNSAPSTGDPAITRSTSQLDFDSKADNFEALVKVVSLEPSYHPNEVELQVTSLQAKVMEMHSLNTAVINALVTLSNARATRNTFLFESSGIHGLALAVKRYVKGVFGFQSVAYNQIRGLRFINQKIA